MILSPEYIASIALLVGSVLKLFGIEIENKAVEGIIAGVLALYIAFKRKQHGDINVLGMKKVGY